MSQEIIDRELGNRPFLATAKRISWPAIFAGVVCAMGVQLFLSLLGVGIGASTIDPLQENNPMAGVGSGAGLWFVFSSLVSLYVGGYVAGRVCGFVRRGDGMLHGILAWGLMSLLTVYLLSSALGRIMGGVTNVFGQTARTVAAVAPQIVSEVGSQLGNENGGLSGIIREGQSLLRDAGTDNGQLGAIITRSFGSAQINDADKETLVTALTERTTLTEPEARQTVDRWQQRVTEFTQQAETQARETGDTVARTTSRAALWSSLALLLGAVAAALGGIKGIPMDKDERSFGDSNRNQSDTDEPYTTTRAS